jgi:hypothetical protein
MNTSIIVITILSISLLACCFLKKKRFNDNGIFSAFGNIIKIEYFTSKPNEAFKVSDTPSREIKNANSPFHGKGAGLDQLILHFEKTTLTLHVSMNQKLAFSAHEGEFFNLGKDNFIKRTIKQ